MSVETKIAFFRCPHCFFQYKKKVALDFPFSGKTQDFMCEYCLLNSPMNDKSRMNRIMEILDHTSASDLPEILRMTYSLMLKT